MKIRLKFSKEGRLKFVGHLDLLRLFQRVIKSAEVPIAYSKGFNPHSLLYFAQALSLGVTSSGEYMDIQLDKEISLEWIKNKFNEILPEGLEIKDAYLLSEESKTCMSAVDAASYTITLSKHLEYNDLIGKLDEFYKKEEILVDRKGKRKVNTINIKEFIYDLSISESKAGYIIKATLATGSRKNLNANLLIQPFLDHYNLQTPYIIHREDLFALQKGELISLSKLGV